MIEKWGHQHQLHEKKKIMKELGIWPGRQSGISSFWKSLRSTETTKQCPEFVYIWLNDKGCIFKLIIYRHQFTTLCLTTNCAELRAAFIYHGQPQYNFSCHCSINRVYPTPNQGFMDGFQNVYPLRIKTNISDFF